MYQQVLYYFLAEIYSLLEELPTLALLRPAEIGAS
jgi:hypothetical protein